MRGTTGNPAPISDNAFGNPRRLYGERYAPVRGANA